MKPNKLERYRKKAIVVRCRQARCEMCVWRVERAVEKRRDYSFSISLLMARIWRSRSMSMESGVEESVHERERECVCVSGSVCVCGAFTCY
jgi:hypothetical protein